MLQLQLTAPVEEFVSEQIVRPNDTRVGSGVTEIVMSELGLSSLVGLVGGSEHAIATSANIAAAKHFRLGVIEAPWSVGRASTATANRKNFAMHQLNLFFGKS